MGCNRGAVYCFDGFLTFEHTLGCFPKHLRDHSYKMCKSLKVDQPSLTCSNQFHCVMRGVQIFQSRVCSKKQMFSMFPPRCFLYL